MNPAISFIFGMGLGAIITFFSIMLFAKYMNQAQKEIYKKMAEKKWEDKK